MGTAQPTNPQDQMNGAALVSDQRLSGEQLIEPGKWVHVEGGNVQGGSFGSIEFKYPQKSLTTKALAQVPEASQSTSTKGADVIPMAPSVQFNVRFVDAN